MQTNLSEEFRGTREGAQAEAIVRKCVHCGFCLATCPTYQLLGDELDSPRGRIYLVKQVLEGHVPTRATQRHLDRCLTCRNCETTCPSGVEYGTLIDIGRRIVEERVERPAPQRAARWVLREGLTSPILGPALRLGQLTRPLLPQPLQNKVPSLTEAGAKRAWPVRTHDRKMLLLAGCVQPKLLPNINPATARVLDAAGIQTIVAPAAGCCGALRAHLADHNGALAEMRRNIDAWWPYLEGAGGAPRVEAIVMNASGCGVTVKEYAKYLAHDGYYAQKALRISQCTRDLCEVVSDVAPRLRAALAKTKGPRVALHVPCTLQHGQKLPATLESLLRALGFDVQVAQREAHLCCGSAGTYSVLEPDLARQLRDRKLAHLRALRAPLMVSANVGCIQHLQSGTDIAVRHWVEALDDWIAAATQ
ncbi:MAG TPA: glycolate oxidase subunit GlcF [Burkholderiaceae bacterium]|nr:glycolate oxidase subunit GlcF [Burkholderiaceae bacterium]